MKFRLKSIPALVVPLAVVLLILPLSTGAQSSPTAGYHDYAALSSALSQLAKQNPNLVKLTSIGKTLKGRDLWMLQVSGAKGPKPEVKQALLICGNAEGDHVIGSEVALGIAQFLVAHYGKEDKVTQVLDKRTFYIIPRLNPDGAEAFFAAMPEERPGNLKPRDEDYDWLVDEDGPDDLNGDGMITMMRVKDKDGEWIVDEKDPRLMKKKDDDTPLDKLYKLYPEGMDDDGDELYNEDGPGGFNINRNFPHNFGYRPKGVGVYAASEPETVALIDFMSKYVPELKTQPHRNICGVLMFSKYDNLAAAPGIECGTPTFPEPPAAAAAPAGGMGMFFMMGRRGGAQEAPQARPTDPQPKRTESRDNSLFKQVSDKYKEITGIKSAASEKPFGSFLEYAYFQYGVLAFSANLWSVREESSGRPQPKMKSDAPAPAAQAQQSDRRAMFQQMMARGRTAAGPAAGSSADNDEKWLKWIDEKNDGKGFVAWTKFDHKQLGEVEIGGFQPFLRINPPSGQIETLSQTHAEFALYLASQFAEIEMEAPAVKKLGSGLYELKVKVHNRGQFPYVTAMGQRTRNITPIVLRLKFADEDNMKLFGGNKRIDLPSLGAGAEQEYKWVIISPAGKKVDITLWARNGGGTLKKEAVLR